MRPHTVRLDHTFDKERQLYKITSPEIEALDIIAPSYEEAERQALLKIAIVLSERQGRFQNQISSITVNYYNNTNSHVIELLKSWNAADQDQLSQTFEEELAELENSREIS